MKRASLLIAFIVLAGCGSREDEVPDAKPVSLEVKSEARAKEIDGPKDFARKRGLNQTGSSRSFNDE